MSEGGSEPKKQLGKIMLQQKLVTQGELQELLQAQQEDPSHRLASTATRRGDISVDEALRALSEQHGVPAAHLDGLVVPLDVMRLIPVEIAREHQVFPFRVEGEAVHLAMASPGDAEIIQEVEFLTALSVVPHVALDDVIRRVLDEAYLRHERQEPYFVGGDVSDAQLAELGIQRSAPLSSPGVEAAAGEGRVPADAALPNGAAAPEAPQRGAIAPAFPAVPATPPPPAAAPAAPPRPAASTEEVSPAAAPGAPAAARAPSEPPTLDPAFGQRTQPSEPPGPTNVHAGKTVLLVDADTDSRGLARTALEPLGLNIVEAHSGVTALERTREAQPQLIIIDDVLPDIHGFDVCRRLKASEAYRGIPLVVTSRVHRGWRSSHDVMQVLQAGWFLEKPLQQKRLAYGVQQLLSGEPPEDELPPLSAQAESLWNDAMASFEQGDVDLAIEKLQQGAALEPEAFELQYHLGLLHGRREELFSSIHALEHAVKLQPRHFSALKNLAVVYQRAGFVRKSFEIWERACWCAPEPETRAQIKEHMLSLL